LLLCEVSFRFLLRKATKEETKHEPYRGSPRRAKADVGWPRRSILKEAGAAGPPIRTNACTQSQLRPCVRRGKIKSCSKVVLVLSIVRIFYKEHI